jgi:aryl-alcohol dehydrogenase-like predicted oxidoreductase
VEYRNLGNSGLQVSVVGLGCNNFGMRIQQDETTEVVNKSIDLGINLFDTADVYGGRGTSETYLGVALGDRRHDVVVASKFAMPMGEGPYTSGGSRKYIMKAVEDSLRRLNTDYIDLYQMHRPDADTPIEETMRALDDLVKAGKVRYIGHSNFSGWQTAEAAMLARQHNLTPFISAQNEYSLLERRVEHDLVPACGHFDVGILPYFPLASGFLTGKYSAGQDAPEGTRLSFGRFGDRYLNDDSFEVLGKLESYASDNGHTILELAMSWLASQPEIGSVIAGATKPEQVESNATAADWNMTTEQIDEVRALLK